jgi:hypothetical protein
MIPAILANHPATGCKRCGCAGSVAYIALVENAAQWHFIAFPPVALFSLAV